MDAIGLMVTAIVDGFLHITEIGGIDPRVLPGQIVTVHGRADLPGMILQPPGFLLPPETGDGPVALEHLLIDTGRTPREVSRLVRVGDLVSFATVPVEMGNSTLAGHSLDNRASVAALTHCLEILRARSHAWDVWAVATVQEEETLGGARTSAYQLDPQLGIAIDVTFARGPGAPDDKTYPMGEAITLCWGPNIHPGFHKAFKEVADKVEIPYQLEATPRHSGTDAFGLQIARAGIPTMVIGIPLRYMHTPVEVISIKDVERVGRLLAEFITGLQPDFMASLRFDD
jgi:endoglucanase